jgi:hypothetical protein
MAASVGDSELRSLSRRPEIPDDALRVALSSSFAGLLLTN